MSTWDPSEGMPCVSELKSGTEELGVWLTAGETIDWQGLFLTTITTDYRAASCMLIPSPCHQVQMPVFNDLAMSLVSSFLCYL